jgi:hypothetical protein
MLEEATSRLAGVWRVVAVEDRPDEESDWVSYGSDPHGLIIYDRSGILSVHLVADGPLPSSAAYIGYWGTFRVVEAEDAADGVVGVVEHHMAGMSTKELNDEDPRRPFRLKGDRLMLGDDRTYRRILERVR